MRRNIRAPLPLYVPFKSKPCTVPFFWLYVGLNLLVAYSVAFWIVKR
jgi:hypothetical protein